MLKFDSYKKSLEDINNQEKKMKEYQKGLKRRKIRLQKEILNKKEEELSK